MAVGVGATVNFGKFSAQICYNMLVSILVSLYHNHYRILFTIAFRNGITLFNILPLHLNSILMTKIVFIGFFKWEE